MIFINVYNFDFLVSNAKIKLEMITYYQCYVTSDAHKFYKYVFILLHASANMNRDVDSISLRLITRQQKRTLNILPYIKCLFAVPGTHYSTISYQVASVF